MGKTPWKYEDKNAPLIGDINIHRGEYVCGSLSLKKELYPAFNILKKR